MGTNHLEWRRNGRLAFSIFYFYSVITLLALSPSFSESASTRDIQLSLSMGSIGVPQVSGQPYTLSRDPNDVHFYFFSNPEDVNDTKEIIHNDVDSLKASGFVAGRRTVFITHGFRSNLSSDMPQTIKNAFLAANANLNLDLNIVVVSWGKLSTPLPPELTASLYTLVTFNVPIVGKRIAEFVLFLRDQKALSLSNVHLIGHSLGSHASGQAGRQIFLETGQKVSRITGLDPAGPNYFPPLVTRNLMKVDAKFVDVIHTNVGVLGDGTNDGHADFYPNGGSLQPGCLEGDTKSPVTLGRCSHWYAYQLYAASITKQFPSCPCPMLLVSYPLHLCSATCDNPVMLGYNCPSTANGEYFLETTNPP